MEPDFLDAMVAKRAETNPEFPAMVEAAASARAARGADATTLRTDPHDRRLARRLAEDPEFAAEYERQSKLLGPEPA